jgi:hypothetical protein
MENGSRVRIECYRRRLCARRFGTFNDRPHYLLVAEMKAIENAQREDRRAKDICVLYAVENFHELPPALAGGSVSQ